MLEQVPGPEEGHDSVAKPTLEQFMEDCSPCTGLALDKLMRADPCGRDHTVEEGKSVRSPPAEEEGAAEATVMYSLIRLCVIFLCRVWWWRDSGPSLRSKSISSAHRRCLWCADPSSSWPSTSSGWRGLRAPQRLSLVRRRQRPPSASLLCVPAGCVLPAPWKGLGEAENCLQRSGDT